MSQFRLGLEALKSYTIEEGDWDIKLDANENAFNLPSVVSERLAKRLVTLPFNRYPEITQFGLRNKIAVELGMEGDNVSIGNGSSELLQAACYVFGGAGKKIVFPTPSFSMYSIYCKLADSRPVAVELEADFSLLPDKMLAVARQEQANLIIVCNPNNPTGTAMPPNAVEQIIAGANCSVIVDEAYSEFHGESALELLSKYPNLIVMRTFSKAYGLASARVGYALASKEITAALSKVLLPFHVNMLSLVAAETVYECKAEFTANIAQIVSERERLTSMLVKVPGFVVYPSRTNFLLFKTDLAEELAFSLAAQGICIRDFSKAPGLKGCLRVSIGTLAENNAFMAAVLQNCKK
jgi:histidinol-phosphate aminotransferase